MANTETALRQLSAEETPAERTALTELCSEYIEKYRLLMPEPGENKTSGPKEELEGNEELVRIADKIKEHVILNELDQEFGLAEAKKVQRLLNSGTPIQEIRIAFLPKA